jgi:hypothetical protein
MALNIIIAYLTASVFTVYCLLLGMAILKKIRIQTDFLPTQDNPYLIAFFAITIGISATILALMLLGFVGLLNPLAIVVAGAFMLGAAVMISKLLKFDLPLLQFKLSQFKSLLLPALLMLTTIAFAWKAPGHWDDTSFHLPLARFYLDHQQILLHEYLRFPLFPQNMNMLITLGFMFGDAPMAQVFATIPWFVITLGLMGSCKWLMGNVFPGIFIALLLAKGIDAFKFGFGYAYVDAGLAMFCWAAILAATIGITQCKADLNVQLKWILLAGFFAGIAAGTKVFGGVLAFILCTYILLATRSLLLSIQFGLLVLASGIWWYVRSFLISGDPFHPIGGEFFGYFLWNEQDLAAQIKEQKNHGVSASLLNLWPALRDAGIVLWGLAFIGLALFKKYPPAVRTLQIVFITYFCFWFFISQVERYLAPVVVIGTFLSIYTLYYFLIITLNKYPLQNKLLRVSDFFAPTMIVICCVLAAGQLTRNISKWDERLQKFNGYELLTKANSLQKDYGSNLLQMGFENAAYFFSGTTIGDHFGKARYAQMTNCQEGCKLIDAESMIKLMANFDSKILVISTEYFPHFDPQSYADHFDFVFSNHQGVLMTVKN